MQPGKIDSGQASYKRIYYKIIILEHIHKFQLPIKLHVKVFQK